MQKQAIKIAFLVLGIIVGAGFASGREIITFFFDYAPFSYVLFLSILLFVFYIVYIFIRVGSFIKPKTISDLTRPIFKKYYKVIDSIAIVSFFIAIFAMLAGVDALATDVFTDYAFPYFSIIISVLTIIIVMGGLKSLLNVNNVIAPVLVFLVILIPSIFLIIGDFGNVTLNNDVNFIRVGSGVFSAVLYVCMNMITTGVILSQLGSTIKQKTAKFIAIYSSIMLTVCVALILTSIINSSNVVVAGNMPMVLIAYLVGDFWGGVYSIVVLFGIFTTLLASSFALDNWLNQFLTKRGVSISLIIIAAFIVSRLGFIQIVDIFYPLEGVFGFIFIAGVVLYYYKNREKIEKNI